MSDIEKTIAFKIPQQFPGIYRENNAELVDLVTHYYKFLETSENQGIYNSRRMQDYRDITTTMDEMIIFFQKKFLADLPLLKESSVRIVIKNILDLYRRKGTESGIILFFRLFYEQTVKINNPSKYMFKPSNSDWRTGNYLQMLSNDGVFYGLSDNTEYSYIDLIGKNIVGSTSLARAVVDKINFVLLNKTITPIIYINAVKGTFDKYDTIVARIGDQDVSFGVHSGSTSDIIVDVGYGGTTGNEIGDELNIQSDYGQSGRVVVTGLQDSATGVVDYTLLDGGFGYTIANTKLLVSDQVILINNEDFIFVDGERLRDSAGNQGTVTGQNASTVGVKMDAGNDFVIGRPISTLERDTNFTLQPYNQVTGEGVFNVVAKNDSSPGPLYPDGSPPDANTQVIVSELDNIETVSLITDLIANYLSVPLNSADMNTVPPASLPMSGTATPVTLATPLDEAFNLTPFEIGTIVGFNNVNPGSAYINDVFSIIKDYQMIAFDRSEQVLLVNDFSAAFSKGDLISQNGVNGLITGVNTTEEYIKVRPYAYYGFNKSTFTHKGVEFTISALERDYNSEKLGDNAKMKSSTQFKSGRISTVTVTNSGFGYIDGRDIFLTNNDDEIQAKGKVVATQEGKTQGFWGKKTSNLNGYIKNTSTANNAPELIYYNSLNAIQDSDYYQEYSYEIITTIDESIYGDTLRKNVHLAGTKMFSKFVHEAKPTLSMKTRFNVVKKEDEVIGGPPIVGPDQTVPNPITYTADRNTITVDDTLILTADYNL
jgi:hypothetical protein